MMRFLAGLEFGFLVGFVFALFWISAKLRAKGRITFEPFVTEYVIITVDEDGFGHTPRPIKSLSEASRN